MKTFLFLTFVSTLTLAQDIKSNCFVRLSDQLNMRAADEIQKACEKIDTEEKLNCLVSDANNSFRDYKKTLRTSIQSDSKALAEVRSRIMPILVNLSDLYCDKKLENTPSGECFAKISEASNWGGEEGLVPLCENQNAEFANCFVERVRRINPKLLFQGGYAQDLKNPTSDLYLADSYCRAKVEADKISANYPFIQVSYFPNGTQIAIPNPIEFKVQRETQKINRCEPLFVVPRTSAIGSCSVCVRVESQIDRILTVRSMAVTDLQIDKKEIRFQIGGDETVESINCTIRQRVHLSTRDQIQTLMSDLGLQVFFAPASEF